VGYQSLKILSQVPAKSNLKGLQNIAAQLANLNGQKINGKLDARLYKLQDPEKVLRERLWNRPTENLMDEATFKKYFPDDEFANEMEPMNFKKSRLVWQKSLNIDTSTKSFEVDKNAWTSNGYYLLELETKDKNGAQVLEKKIIYLNDPSFKNTTAIAAAVFYDAKNYEPS